MTELEIHEINMEAFDEKVLNNDGHGVYDPAYYDEVNFPKGFLPVQTHTSDGSAKGSMWGPNGEMIKEAEGVYHLVLLSKIASSIGAKGSNLRGRGFQARELWENIRHRIKEIEHELVDPAPKETHEEHYPQEEQA